MKVRDLIFALFEAILNFVVVECMSGERHDEG